MMVLAPMYDVTDTVFRQIVVSCGPPDRLVTEFVNVDGLCSPGEPRLRPYLYRESTEVPLVAQIWGIKPEKLLPGQPAAGRRRFFGS